MGDRKKEDLRKAVYEDLDRCRRAALALPLEERTRVLAMLAFALGGGNG